MNLSPLQAGLAIVVLLIIIYAAGRMFGAGWFASEYEHLKRLGSQSRKKLKRGDEDNG